MSLLWSFVMSVAIGAITSEPIIGLIDNHIENNVILALLGRLRTYILAWGTVSFWRMVWLVWDQFLGALMTRNYDFQIPGCAHFPHYCNDLFKLGGTTITSAGVGHVISIIILTLLGCVSSILAPASTMGVDSVPNEDAADEPLFSMLPVPYDMLYLFAIKRQPEIESVTISSVQNDSVIEMGAISKSTERSADILADRKRLPGRMSETFETSAIPEDHVQEEEVHATRKKGSEAITSTLRGWQSEGRYRSYAELQRFNLVRGKSEYAQRPGLSNKRQRSKFFKSR
jgi:hypothetical protein